MKTDHFGYRMLRELPDSLSQAIRHAGLDALRHYFDAIEYKETSVRLDGLFRPIKPGTGPTCIVEVQFYRLETFYASLTLKIGSYLKYDNPHQSVIAIVIYPDRAAEQTNLEPTRFLTESNQLIRIYLDELSVGADELELQIFRLIAAKREVALEQAKALVPKVRRSRRPKKTRDRMLQLILTAILYQYPDWPLEEAEKMLQVTEFEQTRAYKDILEKGTEIGEKRGIEKGTEIGEKRGIEKGIEKVARRMLDAGQPVGEIAEWTGLTVTQIRGLKKRSGK